MDEKIVHFSHNHPLVLKEQEHNDDGIESSCSGCEKPISASSPVFYCDQCDFVLHKSCTKLPHKIKHPEHPEHPLTLLPTAPYYNGLGYICDSCRKTFERFVYHCARCEYDLDIACASEYHPDDGHSHEFTSLDDDDDDDNDDSDSFVCYACGHEATEGSGCVCSVCQIKVHSSCSELPQIVRTKCHHHSLNITYSLFNVFGLMDEDDITCGACKGKLSSSFGGYFCSICKFATHLKCPEKQTEDFEAVTENDETEHVSDSEESHEESSKTGHDQSHHDLDVNKLGHEHLLRFMEELSLQCADELCDVCVEPITAPLFSCSQSDCGFLVHQSCAELPRKKQHKLHPHPLNLLPKAPPYDGIYRCDGCKFLGNGFVYRCDECQFDLDVFCGSLMDKIQHDSHKHTLLLQRTSIEKECRGCSIGSKHVFVCNVCDDFAIDCGCATLPSKVWHMYDKHPLSLRYSVEDDLREHKCGICKEKRSHQKQWFYFCDDCGFGAHTWCVLDKSRRVKFGGTFLYDVLHSHPLALVEKKGKHLPPCEACGEGCNGWTLECGQCKCYFHREGNCFWGKFQESAKYLALSETMRHKYAANVLAATPNVTDK